MQGGWSTSALWKRSKQLILASSLPSGARMPRSMFSAQRRSILLGFVSLKNLLNSQLTSLYLSTLYTTIVWISRLVLLQFGKKLTIEFLNWIVFDCGTLKYDEVLASEYRAASLQYFRSSLLGEGLAPDLSCFDIDLQNGLQCWNEIGENICQVSSRCKPLDPECSFKHGADLDKATREVLCDEMIRYVGSLNNVDSIFSAYGTPTIEWYWERREATAAAYCVIAILPYVHYDQTCPWTLTDLLDSYMEWRLIEQMYNRNLCRSFGDTLPISFTC